MHLEKYFQCTTIPPLTMRSIFIRLAVVASQTYQLAQNSEKLDYETVQQVPLGINKQESLANAKVSARQPWTI